jgi:hypothetical protein
MCAGKKSVILGRNERDRLVIVISSGRETVTRATPALEENRGGREEEGTGWRVEDKGGSG